MKDSIRNKRVEEAVYDYETTDHLMVRCPFCNAWDRALSGAKEGNYSCEECGRVFHVDGRM